MEDNEVTCCRGCMSTNPKNKICDDEDLLKTKFSEVSTLTVENGYLCDDCVDIVNYIHEFRKQCLSIHSQLFAEVEKNKNKALVECDSFIKIKEEMLSDDEDYIMIVVDEKNDCIESGKKVQEENENLDIIKVVKVESQVKPKRNTNLENIVAEENPVEIENTNEDYSIVTDLDKTPISMVASDNMIIDSNEIITDIVEDSNIGNEVALEYDDKNVNFIRVLNDKGEPIDGEIVQYGDETVTFVADLLAGEIAIPGNGVTYTQEEIVVSNGEDALALNSGSTELVILDGEGDEDPITVMQQTDGSFLCDCGEVFKDFSVYREHKENHNTYLCQMCPKKFETRQILIGHMMLHTQDRFLIPCPYCKEVVQRNILTTHIKINHTVKCDRENECGLCFKKFNSKSDAKKLHHESKCETIDGKEKYICKICSKDYTSCGSLKRHIDSVHGHEENKLLCSECGEILLSQKAMYTHLYIHKQGRSRGQKKYICGTCGKGCPSHAMLLMHERVHTGERPYKCTKCTLAFKTKTHLTTHQLTHSQLKQFSCEVCTKSFALKGNLIVHTRTHTGERPYVCNICNQAFIDSKYLKKHKLKRHNIGSVTYNTKFIKTE